MRPENMRHRRLIAALLIGCTFGALTFAIRDLSVLSSNSIVAIVQQLMSNLLWPGLICAFAASGNIHAWPLWIAAVGNFIFYFSITWAINVLWRRVRTSETPPV